MMQHRIAASRLISVSNASNVHARQSALNLIYMLGYSHPVNFEVFGPSDERYAIEGGAERLPQAIADYLAQALA